MIARLAQDQRGISLVEFALCLPFLITLYLGSYQLCDAISAYRKVTTATRAIADLTSQYSTVTDADLDGLLSASQQIMAPYKLSNARLTITQVKIDPSTGAATVAWSKGLNTSGLTVGDAFTVPASIKTKGSYLLVGSINYTYVPVAASSLLGTIPMKDQIILSPRTVACIKHNGDCDS